MLQTVTKTIPTYHIMTVPREISPNPVPTVPTFSRHLTKQQMAVRNLCVPVVAIAAATKTTTTPPPPGPDAGQNGSRNGSKNGSGNAAAINLVRRQSCRALKLLENCLAWQNLLSPQALVPVALGDLVSKRLVPALRGLAALGSSDGGGGDKFSGEALALFERAVELLPDEWMGKLDAIQLRLLGRMFGDGLDAVEGVARKKVAKRVERVVRLQVALGDEDKARTLAQQHGLKIA